MKILSLTNCPLDAKLGSGKTVLTYTQGLRKRGYQVDVAAPPDYEMMPNLGRLKKFRQAWGAWNFVKQKLRTQTYDLIEYYGDEFWLTVRQLAKLPQRPLLVAHTNGLELLDTERSHVYSPQPNPLRRWFAKQTHERFSQIAFNYADAFVSLCELDRKYVLNLGLYPEERTALVEPGIDSEYLAMAFKTQKEERIAYMGNWIPRKGVDHLSGVMTKVLTQHPQLYFDVYGTSGATDTVLASFPSQLHPQIVVYPRLANQDMAQGLAKAQIFFFPSQYEGFGMAIAEAMACSCAVVTTPTGFGAELKDGEEVILCDFNDTEGMEKAIFRLLHDEEKRIAIAQQGWNRVQSLTWEANIDKLARVYSQWAQEARGR